MKTLTAFLAESYQPTLLWNKKVAYNPRRKAHVDWVLGMVRHSIARPHGFFVDRHGWASMIVPFDQEEKESFENMYYRRAGRMYIVDPKGNITKTGYWMDFPEDEWGILSTDYWKKLDAGKVEESMWRKLPISDRLNREAHWQATHYDTLENQARWHQAHPQ